MRKNFHLDSAVQAAQSDNLMFLFEFDQDSAQVAKIVALTNQLKDDVENGEVDSDNFTVDELLDYFQQYDVILDVNDLYNMIKVAPLKTLVKNIQGDKVVFKGQEDDSAETKAPEDENKKIVSKMANSALSNLKSASK